MSHKGPFLEFYDQTTLLDAVDQYYRLINVKLDKPVKSVYLSGLPVIFWAGAKQIIIWDQNDFIGPNYTLIKINNIGFRIVY